MDIGRLLLQILLTLYAPIVGPIPFLVGLVAPLTTFISKTPLELTTQHQVVLGGWRLMTGVADGLLGVFVIIGLLQSMYGDAVGAIRMSPAQLVAKAVLTVLLIHLSAFLGEFLLQLNNALCNLVQFNIQSFIPLVNGGQSFNTLQLAVVSIVFGIIFAVSFFRVLFQVFGRLIRFNVLFVLSGLAFLCSFQPITAPVFSAWGRLYVITIFEQFFQVLTLGLGIQFLLATKLTGFPGFLLAIALINMAAEIPKILERFGAAAGGGGGLGSLVSLVVKAAVLLAAA